MLNVLCIFVYMEEEVDYFKSELAELQCIIGKVENAPPKDKRTKEYKLYIENLNYLFDIYNKKAEFKIYKKIKI